jgi:hypothetical protein
MLSSVKRWYLFMRSASSSLVAKPAPSRPASQEYPDF